MRSGDKWRCARCDHREETPLADVCPGCGVLGERYPVRGGDDPAADDQAAIEAAARELTQACEFHERTAGLAAPWCPECGGEA
jgi:hypothetical protein